MNQELFAFVLQQENEIKTLESILGLLMWDQETIMPHSGLEHRCHQKTILSTLIHKKRIDNKFFEALKTLSQGIENKDSDHAIIIQRILHDTEKARKLPTSFVERFTSITSHAFFVWEQAKPESNWQLFAPCLEKIVDLVREKSSLLGYSAHPLDPLLDEYEPDLTEAFITRLFSDLRPKLQALLEKVKETPFYKAKKPLYILSTDQQLLLSREILNVIGYDWGKSRLDTAAHPFSSAAHPTDSRITIRRNHEDTLDQILSAMHEAGHSLYDMGLDKEWFGTPLGETVSLSIHESQSRFWETIVGRSKMFAPFLFEKLTKYCPSQKSVQSTDELYIKLNSVSPSLIRTEADEVTYPFHVFLRFEIEKELLEGKINVQDIPERWRHGMASMLGVTPTCDKDGCMQDIHWAVGMFGYFPTYALGSMYAASLWQSMKKDIPTITNLIQDGQFHCIHNWLREKVWSQGKRFSSKKLIERATGKPPSEDDFLVYLKEKYAVL